MNALDYLLRFPWDCLVYARALAAVAEWRDISPASVPAPAAARGPLVTRLRRLLGLDVPPEPLFTGRNAGWALALATVALASAGILYSGKLMAQNDDEQDPAVPTLVRPAPRGSVTDAAGHPAPGARVRLLQIRSYWSPDNAVIDETTADAQGRFSLTKPVRFHHPNAVRDPAEYTLLADAPNLAPAWAALSPDDAGDADRRLTLTPPTHQSFVVTDRAGKPLPGAVIEVQGAYRREKDPRAAFLPGDLGLCRTVADDAGRATVEGLPDAAIQFAISKEGFGDNVTYLSQLAGDTQRIALQVASVLEGRVTDPLGLPVAGATVSLYPKFRFHTFFTAKTDAQGHYRIGKIWSDREANPNWKDWGKYEVAVRHPRFTAAAREVVFEGRQTVAGFDLAAMPGTELIGRLLDPQTKAPVADAIVQVDSPSGRQSFLTGADGSFHGRVMPGKIRAFFSQPPRNGFVEEAKSGGLPSSLDVEAIGERLALDLYLPGPLGRMGTVRGQVQMADGETPPPRCQVTAVIIAERLLVGGWGGNVLRSVMTEEGGKFIIEGVPIGLAFTLNVRTQNNAAAGTLTGKLDADALDLPAPVVLQPNTSGGEFMLIDRKGNPRPNLSIAVGPIPDGESYPAQSDRLKSDGAGILRLPHAVPGARYAVTLVDDDNVTRVVNAFDAPATGDAAPPPRRTLVIDPQGLLRLLGPDSKPLPIKRVLSYTANTVMHGKRTRWSNEIPVIGREGADAVIPWKNLAGNRGDMANFLVETDDGNHVRAEGPIPLDGSNLFVIRPTEIMRPDTAPDPTVADAAAGMMTGRVVTPEGEPVAGAAIEMPGAFFQGEKAPPPILSGADGVFRVAMPPYRFSYLTVAKEGWATAFLTDVPVGKGFRVTLRKDTRLRGVVGGENQGRVALLLKKNKFTVNDNSLDHEVRDVALRLTADERGAYDFPVEPGRYRWQASSADGRFATGEINVEAGQAADLGAALQRGADVTFELVDCQSGKPVPGIEVAIFEQRADLVYAAREGSARTSDAGGRIRWENLPPGEKQFVCNSMQRSRPVRGSGQSPYGRWWREDEPREWLRVDYAKRAPTGNDHTSWLQLDVKPGLPPVRIWMERGVKITGRVVGADGKGAPNLSVQAIAQPDRQVNNSNAQTDQDGNFSACLPAGNGLAYWLCAYTLPGQEKPDPGATAISERFQSRPGEELAFQLVMGKGGWFTGRLVAADGQSAAGFKVTAMASDGLEVSYAARIAAAGADGRFRLGPLRPGKYKVYPGTGAGAPLGKLQGAAETAGEIASDGATHDLGDIVLPAGAKRRD
jgi:protocatechuate 3,4-dioxygenase beta subunit